MLVLPAMVHPLILGVTGSTGQFIKLRWLQPVETTHLLIETVACAGRDSFIHVSVGKYRGNLFFFLLLSVWSSLCLFYEGNKSWLGCMCTLSHGSFGEALLDLM